MLENRIKAEDIHKHKKVDEDSAENRIEQLEMEVDILRNFLFETEKRSIKK